MSVNERVEVRSQNPGDLRIPEGVIIKPARRVLILGEEAISVRRGDYDEVDPLFKNGDRPKAEDESEELKVTTRL